MNTLAYSSRIVSLLVIVLLAGLLSASCEKDIDPIMPDPNDTTSTEEPPSQPSYFVCDNDSMAILNVVVMRSSYKSNVYDWSFKLSDSEILKFYTCHNIQQSGEYPLVGESQVYSGGSGVYGVYMEGFEEEDLVSGSLVVKVVCGKPELTLSAITQSGRSVTLHYWGAPHDLSHPIGSGEFQYGSRTLPLEIAYSQLYFDLYEYAFTDTASSFGVTFYSTFPLATGTYTITDDMTLVDRGEALDLWLDLEGSTISGDVSNGSATCTIDGDSVSITFNGMLGSVPVSGSYNGKMEYLGEGVVKNHPSK